jgi:filamentous hemagglutinin family protein
MKNKKHKRARRPDSGRTFCRGAAVALTFGMTFNLFANPQGMTVVNGSAGVSQSGSQLNITASQNAFLDWRSFNIAAGETTTFLQPAANAIAWNRINDRNPSQIFGNLNANGIVVLMNQSGFYFGPNSVIKAAGFVATTATPMLDPGAGGQWEFNGPPPSASIINYGHIQVQSGGQLFLIAEKVENHGVLMAPDGTLGLYAGKQVLISDRPDGRGINVNVSLPEGSVDNFGKLVADAGTIWLHAQTVNQDGVIQANSVQQKNGVIELTAGDAVHLGDHSVISANGDAATISSGGQITIKSDNLFTDTANSKISVVGGGLGGNGGAVEISATTMPSIQSQIDGHANAGAIGGNLLIDPVNINIGNTGSGSAGSGAVSSGSAPGTLNLNVNTAFTGFSLIDLQATANITLAANTVWDLVASTGLSTPGSLLKLEAGNNITINSGASILAGDNWSVTLQAGRNFALPDTVNSGVGNVTFNGTGSLEAQNGNVNLLAGNNITVGSGFVRTMGGGGINATAVGGGINTGTKVNGFVFSDGGYDVDPDLGGISTGAGGDVNLTAGLDITSFLPTGTSSTDGGSGAFGAQAGNVNLTAGGNVAGHFVVRNGTGIINAGVDAGTTTRQLALSLASGGWTVNAGQDILLQEVRNPNGIFNSLGFSDSTTKHYFDYAPDAYVNLNAGNSVQLLAGSRPRNAGSFEKNIPSIYAPILNISAGAGGVQIANNLILFPSPAGNLIITTTGGGPLTGTKAGDLTQIIVSDSASSQYLTAASFGATDHTTTPIHLNDPNPVSLNIAGDMNSVLLVTPKHTEVTVGGNMNNSRLNIQNLHPTDVSFLNVAGDIFNRNEFTSVPLATAPDFSFFDHAYPPPTGSLASLVNRFHYDATTHTLTFQGRMNTDELQTLLALQVQKLDGPTGLPLFDADGNPIVETVAVLDSVTAQALFAASQDVPINSTTGYLIAGPGTFNVNAHNLDLGATLGIRSIGPLNNSALAPLGNSGSAINVNLTGNLDMFSTTISSIAGGNVSIDALGYVNVGSSTFTSSDQIPRGIFTVAKSDVSVIAGGDINVNGSRIAAYDGGNVTVESLHGNVNAGAGGQGVAAVTEVVIDPITHQVWTYSPKIPGSGIMATTFPPSNDPTFPKSHNPVGNILVETPEGNIVANAGGIVQLSYNGVPSSGASITLIAGTKDAGGNIIHPGSIDATGSGVIGANVNLIAASGITGVVIAQNNLNVTAGENVNVTAIASGNVNVAAGGTVSGTIVGVGGINASGSSIDASLLSQNVSAGGNISGVVGFAQANVAGATSQSASNDDEQTKTKDVAVAEAGGDDEQKNKKLPALTKAGRVTVILPKKT